MVIIKKSIIISLFLLILSQSFVLAETPEEAFIYISPIPDSDFILKETTILLRTGQNFTMQDLSNLEDVEIEGDSSGIAQFATLVSDDYFTAIIDPIGDFTPGESVTVAFDNVIVNGTNVDGSFKFIVSSGATQDPSVAIKRLVKDELYSNMPSADSPDANRDVILNDDVTLPFDFPPRILLENDNPDSGYVFLANWGRDAGTPYIMILDNEAYPVFYKKMPDWTWDFKVHPNRLITYIVEDEQYWYIMDSTYTVIDSVSAQNGYFSDEHDIQMLDNGHILLAAYDVQELEDPDDPDNLATNTVRIAGYIIQELDTNRNVVFQWRSWDYLDMGNTSVVSADGRYSDPVHGNTLELDHDGNLLTCFRNKQQFAKIDMTTGDIIWKLGGGDSDFTIVNYPQGWSMPHDIRRLNNGNISIYDNARLQPQPYDNSGALELELDTTLMTCTMVWEYKDPDGIYGPFMGNAQRLPNGNTMIGWGGRALVTATECRMDSTVAWEMTFVVEEDDQIFSYRAFRFPWNGAAVKPYLVAEATDSSIHLVFNQFGDTDVAYFKIYGGNQPEPSTLLDTTSNTYTFIHDITSSLMYFRVSSVSNQGIESDYSNEEEIHFLLSNIYVPGDASMAAGLWPPSVIGGDVTYLVNYFRGLNAPCNISGFYCAADVNGDCLVIGSDVTFLVNYFRGFNQLSFCQEYGPAWESSEDIPLEAPANWPPCE